MESFHHTHPSYLELTKWTYPHPKLTVGLTTRIGGAGEPPFDSFNLAWHVPDQPETIRKNRETLSQILDFPLESWVGGEQVHMTDIKRVTKKDIGKGATSRETAIPDCDGLITNEPNVLLTAFYADCVPLFFFDPVRKWVGIAHAGWRGTVAEMGPKMIEALEKNGCERKHIRVAVGPSIGGGAYEVDDAVIHQIPKEFQSEPTVISKGNGKYLLSLQHMHKELLLQSGIDEDHIEVSEYCTYENSHLFFSHRRDKGKTGRMLGFIGFKD